MNNSTDAQSYAEIDARMGMALRENAFRAADRLQHQLDEMLNLTVEGKGDNTLVLGPDGLDRSCLPLIPPGQISVLAELPGDADVDNQMLAVRDADTMTMLVAFQRIGRLDEVLGELDEQSCARFLMSAVRYSRRQLQVVV